jgi:hypothetical protein
MTKLHSIPIDCIPLVYDLLAVIHRDGGHYINDHGIKNAIIDAMQIVWDDRKQFIAEKQQLENFRSQQ